MLTVYKFLRQPERGHRTSGVYFYTVVWETPFEIGDEVPSFVLVTELSWELNSSKMMYNPDQVTTKPTRLRVTIGDRRCL